MKVRAHTGDAYRNRILRRLPAAVLRRLGSELQEVDLIPGDSLYEADARCRYVYFPEVGMASILSVLRNGAQTEVATVGNEGMIGLPVFLGSEKSTARRAVWQMAGRAYRLPATVLRSEAKRGGPLLEALHHYAQALFTQMSQLATCGRFHSLTERSCCWLLQTHDRVDGDEFALTHEFLAEMLGARRPGITEILGNLQRAGLIEPKRGRIRIRNRSGLEEAACECYGVVRGEYDRLLGR